MDHSGSVIFNPGVATPDGGGEDIPGWSRTAARSAVFFSTINTENAEREDKLTCQIVLI